MLCVLYFLSFKILIIYIKVFKIICQIISFLKNSLLVNSYVLRDEFQENNVIFANIYQIVYFAKYSLSFNNLDLNENLIWKVIFR